MWIRKSILILLLIFNGSCADKISNCSEINKKSIIFINKTNDFIGGNDYLEITDYNELNNICDLLLLRKDVVKQPNVKRNNGFIHVVFKENKDTYFYLIFSESKGPIIYFNNIYYHNPALIKLIKAYLNIKK